MNKKKEKKVEFEADDNPENYKTDEIIEEKIELGEKVEADGYNFYCEKDKFVIAVSKGDRIYRVVRPAKEIHVVRKILNKLNDQMLLARKI